MFRLRRLRAVGQVIRHAGKRGAPKLQAVILVGGGTSECDTRGMRIASCGKREDRREAGKCRHWNLETSESVCIGPARRGGLTLVPFDQSITWYTYALWCCRGSYPESAPPCVVYRCTRGHSSSQTYASSRHARRFSKNKGVCQWVIACFLFRHCTHALPLHYRQHIPNNNHHVSAHVLSPSLFM